MSLDDILVTPLSRIPTQGGDVLHAMKQCDPDFCGFGEACFSWVDVGAIKAGKHHTEMTMNLVAPVGNGKFVFLTDYADAPRTEETGVDHYSRLTVPPGIWFGFKGLTSPRSLLLNLADILHRANEVDRLPISEIEYDWK